MHSLYVSFCLISKKAFNAHLDGLTFVAKSIGAVNTVVRLVH